MKNEIRTEFNYDLEYDLSKGKLQKRLAKSRAKKAKKAMVFKKIRKFIQLGLMAAVVVGTLTTAKNFKVGAVRVATNEEMQTLLASHNTYSDNNIISEKEEFVAQEEVINSNETIAPEDIVEETVIQEEVVVKEDIAQETISEEIATIEVAVEKEVVAQEEVVAEEETIIEEAIIEEEAIVSEDVAIEDNVLDCLIYDKAVEILDSAISEDIVLVSTKASNIMFKSQGDKTEFSPWEELFGTNVYRYPGLRFKVEAKIKADRMSLMPGFDNNFYVVVDNIDRQGIEYNISLDVDEIMEMISNNGKTAEETKAVIEKHGDFFKDIIAQSKKDIEEKVFGNYINGMKTDNEFYKALNNQLLDAVNNEWQVKVLGAEA